MHNGFLDKKRRLLNLREMQVENVLPEHFAQFYPKFIDLLKNYYEWQDQNDPNELLNHLFAVRDINETDITLLSFIEDEFLLGEAYFEGFGTEDFEKRAAANFSNTLFRSKGTKFAIEWFFRSFYGLDADVIYPKENVFTLNNTSSQIGPDSLRYLTNDKLYQTFALLIRVGVPISKWRDIFKLFAHPAGMYLGAEVSVDDVITPAINAVMQDSAVTQRPSPVWELTRFLDSAGRYSEGYIGDPVYNTLTGNIDSVPEGTIFRYKISGTNIPAGTGTVRYFVDPAGGDVASDTSTDDFYNFDSAGAFNYTPPYEVPLRDSKAILQLQKDSPLGPSFGYFTIPTGIDSVETEGQEAFTVFVEDVGERTIASDRVVLNDVITKYQMNSFQFYRYDFDPVPTFMSGAPGVDEGDDLEIIVGHGSGSLYDGNPNTKAWNSTTLYWYGKHISTTDSDFVTPLPDSNNPQPVNIRPTTISGSPPNTQTETQGVFTIPIRGDTVSEASEHFAVILQTYEGIKKDSVNVQINNTAATFTVTPSAAAYTEGDTLSFTINHSSQDGGDLVTWQFTGGLASDPRPLATSGSFNLNSGTSTTFSIQVRADTIRRGVTNGFLQVTNSKYSPALVATSSGFNVFDQSPIYNLTMNPTTANEGDTVTFDVSGSNIADGTYYLQIGNVGTNNLDFLTYAGNGGAPGQGLNSRASITVTNNSGTSSSLVFADSSETADESFYAYLHTSPTVFDPLVSSLNQIRGGAAATYTLTPNKTRVPEGETLTFTFTTTGADGIFDWQVQTFDTFLTFDGLRGLTPNDFGKLNPTTGEWDVDEPTNVGLYSYSQLPYGDEASAGNGMVVSGGTGTFSLLIRDDGQDEDSDEQDFWAIVKNSSGVTLAQSASVRILDASATDYNLYVVEQEGVRDSAVTEGTESLVLNFTTNAAVDENLYFELQKSDALGSPWSSKWINNAQIYVPFAETDPASQVLKLLFTQQGGADFNRPIFDGTYEGEQFGVAYLSRNDFASNGGDVLDTMTFSVLDAPATWTLTASPSTTVNEGDTISWVVGGTNIPNGTYYANLTDYDVVVTDGSGSGSGQSAIRTSDPEALNIPNGSVCVNNANVPGTVTGKFAVTLGDSILYYQINMSENLTANVQNTRLVFGSSETLADFDAGSERTFTMTNNVGGFTTVTATNDDTIDDTYTMAVYDQARPASPVASVGFTITDTTVGGNESIVNFQLEPAFTTWAVQTLKAYNNEFLNTAVSGLQFRSDGGIYGEGNIIPGTPLPDQYIKLATWHQAATTTGNFTLTATIQGAGVPSDGGVAQGSYGTNLSLSSTQQFDLIASARQPTSRFASMLVSFTITDDADPTNTDTQSIAFFSELEYIGTDTEIEP
jgi:hypothetical protein